MLVEYVAQMGIDPQSQDGVRLLEESILCLAGVTGAFRFQFNVKSIDLTPTGMSGKDFRLGLLEHSYRTLNIKYAALYLSMLPNKPESYDKLRPMLSCSDIDVMRRLFSRRKVKAQVKAHAKTKGLTINDVTPKALALDKKRFDHYAPKIMTHIKSRVGAKLWFVVKSENGTSRDFAGDVTCKALRAYHSLLPTKQPEAYVLNYLRRAASNETLNIVEKHTTGKRRRMVATGKEDRPYEVICRSENQTGINEEGESEYSLLLSSQADPDTENQTLDSAILMHRLMARFKGRKLRALQILAGGSDEGFNRFLRRKNKLNPDQDHLVYQARVSRVTYLETLAQYLGVFIEPFMHFVQSVGRLLTAHKEYA